MLFLVLGAFLLSVVVGCSPKGVHMPKHRKRRHCDCPTFAQQRSPTTASSQSPVYYGTGYSD